MSKSKQISQEAAEAVMRKVTEDVSKWLGVIRPDPRTAEEQREYDAFAEEMDQHSKEILPSEGIPWTADALAEWKERVKQAFQSHTWTVTITEISESKTEPLN